MKELGQDMLKHCGGLPLAIIVLSGLVSTKYTTDEWEMLHKIVKAYISKGKGKYEHEYEGVYFILSLSYDELPYQLKPCFLHLAHSPEDHEIMVKRLCYTWIAEGFVSLDHQQTQSSMVTIEDVAYDYLNELVERNMLQIGTLGSTGRIKSCRIHDLMRDLSLLKAQEENVMQFIDLRNRSQAVADSTSSAAEPNVEPGNKVRRLAIYADRDFNDLLPFVKNEDGSLRSLIFIYHDPSASEKVLKLLFNLGSSLKLPKEIGKLIHLRLLSLHGSKVENIPSSIGNLRCLQTLDLRAEVDDKKVPNVIWRLEQLRHL